MLIITSNSKGNYCLLVATTPAYQKLPQTYHSTWWSAKMFYILRLSGPILPSNRIIYLQIYLAFDRTYIYYTPSNIYFDSWTMIYFTKSPVFKSIKKCIYINIYLCKCISCFKVLWLMHKSCLPIGLFFFNFRCA